jgi:hypothetical protein
LKKKIGKRIRIQTYISQEMYEALSSLADPLDISWESSLARRAIAEYLDKRGKEWREPEEGQRVDRITSSAKSKHEQRSRPAQER